MGYAKTVNEFLDMHDLWRKEIEKLSLNDKYRK